MKSRWMACLVALLAAVAGCSSTNPRFYTLDSTATANGSPATRTIVTVEPVTVPASVDQPQLVLQVGPNRVEVEEFDRWAAPLEDGIANAVAVDLGVLLASPNVTTASLASLTPDYVVTINVQRFESVKGESAVLDAVWVVRGEAGGKTRSGRTVAREVVHGDGFEALAAAHSQAIAQLSQDIAVAIRTETDENLRSEAGSNPH